MATSKTTQNEQSPTADQQTDSSSENESKQMTKTSTNNELNRPGAESQQTPTQPQTQQPVQPVNQETGKKSSAPRVKLDMDLDVEQLHREN
ncbi:hypothetical protein DER45DRAFT_570679 [Fusarium avenaceum]|nr:hypothetical protein DER45DRAFT_570679 [Fusarium avenaceum]